MHLWISYPHVCNVTIPLPHGTDCKSIAQLVLNNHTSVSIVGLGSTVVREAHVVRNATKFITLICLTSKTDAKNPPSNKLLLKLRHLDYCQKSSMPLGM